MQLQPNTSGVCVTMSNFLMRIVKDVPLYYIHAEEWILFEPYAVEKVERWSTVDLGQGRCNGTGCKIAD